MKKAKLIHVQTLFLLSLGAAGSLPEPAITRHLMAFNLILHFCLGLHYKQIIKYFFYSLNKKGNGKENVAGN